MPQTTYGPQIHKRVKRLLEALLCFVDGELADGNLKIEYDWKGDKTSHKLTIKTTLVSLELLTQIDKYPGKLIKSQIREALNLLKDLLKILEDNRTQTRGSEHWHFTLKLWSRDKDKNLKRFDDAWKSSVRTKSPELTSNSTQEDVVIVAPQVKLTPFQAPPLPTHFVERPEHSEYLKTCLLDGSASDSRTLVITVIHGLGSVGKSTLAAALAHDPAIQTRFCDGILWATLGQEPDVLSLLGGWVQVLGDYSFQPTSTEATSAHLRTLLYDKAVLLVVDDAWNTQDAQAFNVGGARCQVLITTRESAIADVLAASTYSLDIMTDAQAMELLKKKLGRKITDAERQSAATLAKGVGYLPLGLELAAAQVADGTDWTVLLQDIQQEIARLKTFDRPGARDITDEASLKRLSLRASLSLSLKRLPEEEREYFTWLGVLPKDVAITPKLTATLWDMADERDACDVLEYLRSKALLLLGVAQGNGTPTYRLHNLFHDLARNFLIAPVIPKRPGDLPGLGISLAQAHAALLEKYRQRTQNNLWHTLPDVGYIHQHLVWHLEKAGQIKEIHHLLQEESAIGNNGWFAVREKLGQIGGYITDIAHAWELTEANWTEATIPQVVGLQCRYALITASLHSLAANVSGELLMALVKNNVWTAEQGLAYTLQKPEPKEKVKVLAELVNYLLPHLEKLALAEALTAARAIHSVCDRAQALNALANKLPKVLPEALAAARAIQDDYHRAQALSALANKLPKVLPEALAAARTIQDDYHRALALSALANKLPEVLPEALTAARAIQFVGDRALALSALADKLPEVLPEVLTTARAIQDESERADVLSALVDKLPPELLPETLTPARAIQFVCDRTRALSSLADQLPPELLPEALTAARAIQFVCDRTKALSSLADQLPPELLPEALTAAKAIQDESERADALIALADKLPPELLPEALAAARAIQDESDRAKVLSALANQLPPELLKEALAATRAIQDEYHRADALSALAAQLPPELLPKALTIAREIEDESDRAKALSALANKLPEVLPEALAAIREIHSVYNRVDALSALADKLPEVLPEALAAARAIQDEYNRAQALSALANKLPEVLPEALAAARAIQDEYNRTYVLSTLADKLPEVLPEALAVARAIQDECDRADALSALADKLPEVLPEALAAARAIQDEYNRAQALSALADKLPEVLPEALAAARAIQDEYHRADFLSALADKLPEVLPEALTAARVIQDEYNHADFLSTLPDKLPEVLPEALTIAKAIQFVCDRAQSLSALADKLSPELLPEALTAACAIHFVCDRAQSLSALAEKLPEVLPDTLAVAKAIQDESEFADKLPPELLPEALAAARAIQDESECADTLSVFAEKLPLELSPEPLATKTIQFVCDRADVLSTLTDKESLSEALAVARTIEDECDRADALSKLAPSLSQLPFATLFPLWQDTLYQLSHRTRPNLLQDIKALFPVILTLGGEAATAEVARAIQDVARWWP